MTHGNWTKSCWASLGFHRSHIDRIESRIKLPEVCLITMYGRIPSHHRSSAPRSSSQPPSHLYPNRF
ncbi:hypothetical protein Bca4012_051965 [Brassica carinata]|uniref:Uncharacterized protein n=2 Tax=Brassica TaxID=3705 RepID=A0A8X7R8K6_BRACI|nr:hypothetical protein Bca52824_054508 [Brassica carinata]